MLSNIFFRFPFEKYRNLNNEKKLQQPFNSLELSETRNTSCTFSPGLKIFILFPPLVFVVKSKISKEFRSFLSRQSRVGSCLFTYVRSYYFFSVGGWHSAIRFLSLNSNTRCMVTWSLVVCIIFQMVTLRTFSTFLFYFFCRRWCKLRKLFVSMKAINGFVQGIDIIIIILHNYRCLLQNFII